MATYNGENYLKEQIYSILNQSKLPDIIYILDDFSTDSTYKLLLEISNKNSRVIVNRNQTNIGVVNTFEKLLLGVDADIVFLCDQDDVWHNRKVELMCSEFVESNVQCVISNATVIHEDGSPSHLLFADYFPGGMSIFNQLIKNHFIGCCMAVRRSVINNSLPFPQKIPMHDWWLGSVALSLGAVKFLPQPLICYRRHSSTVTGRGRRSLFKIFLNRYNAIVALLFILKRNFVSYIQNE